jgi:hypothetical protein
MKICKYNNEVCTGEVNFFRVPPDLYWMICERHEKIRSLSFQTSDERISQEEFEAMKVIDELYYPTVDSRSGT